MRFGSGVERAATAGNLAGAARLAAATARAALGGQAPDLACVFISGLDVDDIATAGEVVVAELGAAALIGCSASGVIGPETGCELEPAVAVWAAVLPGARIQTFHLDVVRSPDGLTVLGLPDPEIDDAVGVLLADPWSFPVDGFVELSNEVLPGLPLVGGLAGSALATAGRSTWLACDDDAFDSGAVGVLIGGEVDVSTVVSQGCRPVGPTMVVTSADGNELLSLAGMPASEKLQEVLAALDPEDRELALTGLQIGIAMDEYAEVHERGDFLIRGVAGLHPDRGSIVVGDVVEVGRTVRFQVRDATAAHDELTEVLTQFRTDVGTARGALLFSCNGRGASMFGTADHDAKLVAAGLDVPALAGFFAGGEIGPVGGRNHLHGFTASILAFGSADS
ncbi:FIST N-terminal domain-containing protein [Sporichthya brevicatena]|uniref:FIST N-terminal domain-containing protein n=1 Tax=Sporichthya brevicatena TaxID=171442 RepID=A0ABP3RLJ7_9ACTN